MLRNADKMKNITGELLATVVEQVAQVCDVTLASEASVDLKYDDGTAVVGDLIPKISIGVTRVMKPQVTPMGEMSDVE